MFPIKALLHPTDLTEASRHAFDLACQIARDRGARVVVLHVVPPPNRHSTEVVIGDLSVGRPIREPLPRAGAALSVSDFERERRLVDASAGSREVYEGIIAKTRSAAAAVQAAKSQVVEAQAAIDAAIADADRLRVDIDDGVLVAPRRGRVQYRLAEPGEVLAPGGRVLDTVDMTGVYMLFYLPEAEAGKVAIGAEARMVFDALPDVVIPANVYFVAPEAQFTPKTVETRKERQKLAFQVRARIDPALLRKDEPDVKIGLPGVVYVRLGPAAQWPERLRARIPELGGPQP
jgi:HlyD family secretion protein